MVLNPTTPLKQYASVPLASAVLGNKAVSLAMAKQLTRVDVEEISKWTPTYWVIEVYGLSNVFGMAMPNDVILSRTIDRIPNFKLDSIQKTIPLRTKIRGATEWIQRTDLLVQRRIWLASKIWVEQNTDLKKGSDAYFRKAAEMFNKTLFETQDQHIVSMQPLIQRHGTILTLSLIHI